MGDNKESVRNHLIFGMKPNLEFTLEWQFDDISDCNMRDMQEFEIIFYNYDNSGELWKYLDVNISITNAGFCELKKYNIYYHTDTTEDDVVHFILMKLVIQLKLCDVINDEHTTYKLMTIPLELPEIDYENSKGKNRIFKLYYR